jgi:hypothetical protein
MTLLLAVNSSSPCLNPDRVPLRFEPGVALAVDTRFSVVGSTRRDDRGAKWFELAPFALAAYCGDVQFAETVFRCTAASCIENKKLDDPLYIRSALRTLGTVLFDHIAKKRSVQRTMLVCGIRVKPAKFELYVLDSGRRFKIEKQRDIIILGHQDATSFIRPYVRPEIASFISGMATSVTDFKITPRDNVHVIERRQPSDVPVITIQQLTGLLGCLVNDAIRKAGTSTIGGATSMMTLSNAGICSVDGHKRDPNGNWTRFSPDALHRTLLANTKVEGPLLDARGRIVPNVTLDI